MAAMERAIDDPDVAISYYYIATLMELAMASRMGPSPLYPEQAQAHNDWLKRTRPIAAEYTARFTAALEAKRGAARGVSMETLERLRREVR